MKERYEVRRHAHAWYVWDLVEDEALASFDSPQDAEVCRAACELARRDAQAEESRKPDRVDREAGDDTATDPTR